MIYPTNFILSDLDMILTEFDHESVKRQEVLLSNPVSPDAFLLIEFSVEFLGISTKLVLWGMSHLVLIEIFQSKLWEFWLKTWIMRKMQSHSFQLKFFEFWQILNHEARHTLHSFQSKLWEFGWVPARHRQFTLCTVPFRHRHCTAAVNWEESGEGAFGWKKEHSDIWNQIIMSEQHNTLV